jgi:hypothetical protein
LPFALNVINYHKDCSFKGAISGIHTKVGTTTSEVLMAVKVAINGFGRIGRNILRAMVEQNRRDLQLVAINDLGSVETNAHLFRYDSVHGRFHGEVKIEGDTMDVGQGPFKVLAEKDPTKLPWKDLGVDIVMECTGIFSDKEKAAVHLQAGARKVLVSAPSKGADITVVYGVNHDQISFALQAPASMRLGMLLEECGYGAGTRFGYSGPLPERVTPPTSD